MREWIEQLLNPIKHSGYIYKSGQCHLFQTAAIQRVQHQPHWSNPPFLMLDIRVLWCSGLSARAPECQKIRNGGLDQYGKVYGLNRIGS